MVTERIQNGADRAQQFAIWTEAKNEQRQNKVEIANLLMENIWAVNATDFMDTQEIWTNNNVRQKNDNLWNDFDDLMIVRNQRMRNWTISENFIDFDAQMLENEITNIQARNRRLDNALNTQRTTLQNNNAMLQQRQEELDNKKAEFEQAKANLAQEEKRLDDIQNKLMEKDTQRREIENQIRNLQVNLFANENNAEGRTQITNLRAKLAEINNEFNEFTKQFFTQQNAVRTARRNVNTSYGQSLLLDNETKRLTGETARIQNNIKTIENMKTENEAALNTRNTELQNARQINNTRNMENTRNIRENIWENVDFEQNNNLRNNLINGIWDINLL